MDSKINFQTSVAMTKRDLFLCFLYMGLVGFGGVLPWARRVLVEQRKWLSSEEFAEALSLGQILPGPNVVNLSIMVGRRFHGAAGAVLAVKSKIHPLWLLAAAGILGVFGWI